MQNVTRKGYIKMLKEELERYEEVFDRLKDDESRLKNSVLIKYLSYLAKVPMKYRDNDDGITFLILNAIRKHRGIPYPTI